MGLMARTAIGALAGGAYGGMGGGGTRGAIGGAAAGAAVGGAGFSLARGFARGKGWGSSNIRGAARWGLGKGIQGAKSARGAMTGYAGRALGSGNVGYTAVAAGYGADMTRAAGHGMMNARKWIGNNATATNKYGGYALGAMGTASAAHIGSSIMSSNRGY